MDRVGIVEAVKAIETPVGSLSIFDLHELEGMGLVRDVSKMPYSAKVLLENLVRNYDGDLIGESTIRRFAEWLSGRCESTIEVPLYPSRILLQDYTGVPLLVDLAAMRDAILEMGLDPSVVNPIIPAHLVIDHSVSVDHFGTHDAYRLNIEAEYRRNRERYVFLKWAESAFKNFRVVPPGKGIVHQINIEYLTKIINVERRGDKLIGFPEIVLGTDSHTTMVNGLGVAGWGVGGIEAEAALLGLPYHLSLSGVVGVKLVGELQRTATATDLALAVTETLRRRSLVGKFVEFFGPSVELLRVPDRATVSNMAPEYGATIGYFPVDAQTIDYLLKSGRPRGHVKAVEIYCRAQGLFLEDYGDEKVYSEVVEIDLSDVEPSIAGPANPEDRIKLRQVREVIEEEIKKYRERRTGIDSSEYRLDLEGGGAVIRDGAVVIAAITSCTNTSNPSLMIGAGLLAKKAVERGLSVKPYVKTSLAPGSRVVAEYLRSSGLLQYLERLGFHVVGYGCTTCIGNSGPLIREVGEAIEKHDLYACAVISGNRNFEGRIHPQVRACFLASPLLVVAYAIAGRLDVDLTNEPLGYADGRPVFISDVWPSREEIEEMEMSHVLPQTFVKLYEEIFRGDELWESLPAPSGEVYSWDLGSTYIRKPPFLEGFKQAIEAPSDIRNARVLVLLGDRVTTDHISPAGAIPLHSPAGAYLRGFGLDPTELHTYGARRGNHEVMVRGTFANARLRNHLLPGVEGWYTIHLPSGERMTIFDAAQRYQREGTSLIIIAGKQYGAGSSRDWAAKGVRLLGVRAVIAESYERIHRSNLICMGVLPLQFEPGEGWRELGLDGTELYDVEGISEGLTPRKKLRVVAKRGELKIVFKATALLETWAEVEYYTNGGILPYVLRRMLSRLA
jgi:aconitate hydratase